MRHDHSHTTAIISRIALAVLVGAGLPQTVRAQVNGVCNAFLVNGPLRYEQLTSNSTFMRIVYSRFMQSNYASGGSVIIAGIVVPVARIVMGEGYYNTQQFSEKQQQIESSGYPKIAVEDETSALVGSGDARIVEAWSNCTRAATGVFVTLDAVAPTVVHATIMYRVPPGGVPVHPEQPITLLPTPKEVLSGQECLTTRYLYRHAAPCRVVVELAGPLTPLRIDATMGGASAFAFVPPRVEQKVFVEDVVFLKQDTLVGEGRGQYRNVTNVVDMPQKRLQEGWRFVVDGAALYNLVTVVAGDGVASCSAGSASASTSTQLRYFYTVAPNSTCRMDPIAQMSRVRFVPMGQ